MAGGAAIGYGAVIAYDFDTFPRKRRPAEMTSPRKPPSIDTELERAYADIRAAFDQSRAPDEIVELARQLDEAISKLKEGALARAGARHEDQRD